MLSTSEMIKWLNVKELQSVQKSFTDISGMSAIVVDNDGKYLSQKTGGSTFCDLLVEQCDKAYTLCKKCRHYGTCEAATLGHSTFYYCHMGLVEFSAPIIVEGQVIASIVGGMVFDKPPKEADIREYAQRYGIDPDFLWDAARKVRICDISEIEKNAHFLYGIADVISNTVSSKINMDHASKEIERAAQMKNDFLANMSHEIRTPMNAVIGMADLALNEQMSPSVKEYLEQIQNSGKALLHIINDILDYSKISSGKMDIFEEEYTPAIIIRDVSSIIMNRLKDKADKVSLTIDASPSIPQKLIGDGPRIQQILINIANNAVKFTNEGQILISIESRPISPTQVSLCISVKDTGIGIRKEDINKLFESFSQVDSKRNRNVEGTGLGLAIVKQLVDLMHGEITVESEYGVGSTFSFEIPQTISENASSEPLVRNASQIALLETILDPETRDNLVRIADRLNIDLRSTPAYDLNINSLNNWINQHSGLNKYIFVDQKYVENIGLDKFGLNEIDPSTATVIIIADAFASEASLTDNNNIKVVRKPIQTYNISNLIDPTVSETDTENKIFAGNIKFTAPEARVLIVDDVAMNLKLAQRLIARLEIQSDLASSGQEALDLFLQHDYDIIFMDHMMPGLDGIDTTRILRRFYPKHGNIPIIALTANVIEDAKKMFLDEGMNDVIAKPIDSKLLNQKIFQWLPKNKIKIQE